MTDFTIHILETAPAAARPLLEAVKSKMGLIPNVLAELAEAPNVLKAYLDLSGNIAAGTLSGLEQQIVQIAASRLNGCDYCVAAHSTMADTQKLDKGVIEALRNGTAIADAKLEALHQFTIDVVGNQGFASQEEINAFLKAGYTKAQVLEVVLSLALKTISNYTNHLVNTPLDAAFEARAIDLEPVRQAS